VKPADERVEGRDQRSEVGGQKSEVGGRRTEVGSQRSERIKESPTTRSVEPDTPALTCRNVPFLQHS